MLTLHIESTAIIARDKTEHLLLSQYTCMAHVYSTWSCIPGDTDFWIKYAFALATQVSEPSALFDSTNCCVLIDTTTVEDSVGIIALKDAAKCWTRRLATMMKLRCNASIFVNIKILVVCPGFRSSLFLLHELLHYTGSGWF